jgi:hypothetical protein
MPPHLLVDISAHGLGHLAQTAPILNELRRQLPALRLTVRSTLPLARLRARLAGDFDHLEHGSDFGYIMHDAVRIDRATTAAAYREFHADWAQRVAREAAQLRALAPDLLLTDVAYLPLAGAEQSGIAALAMCSLNWAELFAHFFGGEPWAAAIHQQMLAAYRSAECFLRLTPAMPMDDLPRRRAIAPVATLANDCRQLLRARLACSKEEKLVLIAFGGFDVDLPLARWPINPGVRWLIPGKRSLRRDDMSNFEALDVSFSDLLGSVDAVLTKPGYGTFTDAACSATPVLYVRRDDWPEQDCLIDWLKANARCAEVSAGELANGQLAAKLDSLWRQAPVARPAADGARQVAALLLARLTGRGADAGPS